VDRGGIEGGTGTKFGSGGKSQVSAETFKRAEIRIKNERDGGNVPYMEASAKGDRHPMERGSRRENKGGTESSIAGY